jgi:hypothetical protein
VVDRIGVENLHAPSRLELANSLTHAMVRVFGVGLPIVARDNTALLDLAY